MVLSRRGFALALAVTLVGLPTAPAAQPDATPLSDAAIEEFLRTARVLRTRATGKGVTGSLRATLSNGTTTHDAHIQTIDRSKSEFRARGVVEFNFRDTWKFNVAAYRIDRMLGLALVPVSVERRWSGQPAAFTWWVDDVLMDEGERLAQTIPMPNPGCWSEQMRLVRMFDQLIDNVDRNTGNILITNTWRVWAIDHTRAFRALNEPRSPEHLTRIDRTILERLKTLDFVSLRREVGRYLSPADLRALLSRRDAIVAHFVSAGEPVLYDRQDPVVGCVTAPR